MLYWTRRKLLKDGKEKRAPNPLAMPAGSVFFIGEVIL